MMTVRRKKLIEVSIPLEAINEASVWEKSIARLGHPSLLHLWWARRPLAACRAVLFAQLVDDPSGWPKQFPNEEAQKKERERLHKIIARLVKWENLINQEVLNEARWEIARSVARRLGEKPPEKDDTDALLAYLEEKAPPVYDPFCGSGSIPLEAQRLGLRAYGSDLNPVAVLISKALVEIPQKFNGLAPVNPERAQYGVWNGAAGLAEDFRYYGNWIRVEAERRLNHLYPKAKLNDGGEAQVIAWIWTRTVASPDPICKGAHVPLASSFMLSTKKNRKAWVEVIRDSSARDGYRFGVKTGDISAVDEKTMKAGTKPKESNGFVCAITGTPIGFDYVREQGKSKKMGVRLMAVFVEGKNGRTFISPTEDQERAAEMEPANVPELNVEIPKDPRAITVQNYGITKWSDLFTARQLTAVSTFSDLICEARQKVFENALAVSLPKDDRSLALGGKGAVAYADALATYLGLSVDRLAEYNSALCSWINKTQGIRSTFGRPALPMIWDFGEANPLSNAAGSYLIRLEKGIGVIETLGIGAAGECHQVDAPSNSYLVRPANIATDPPYYDNIGYADLSDFFYVWLRRSMRDVWPNLFRYILTPKDPELVAATYRHKNKEAAEKFFMEGMKNAFKVMYDATNEDIPITIYYAFKQSEISQDGITSAGWASFLQAVIDAGFIVDGTWPIRTERSNRMRAIGSNALASSVVLVCIKRPSTTNVATRREFTSRLKREMPDALSTIMDAGVGPVDMAQSALGPGMGVFSSYTKVLESDDSKMNVRTAIALVNEVREEILGEDDAHYDILTRFCIDWFQTFGTEEAISGDAINMANAYSLGLSDLEQSGVLHTKGGYARLLRRDEMPTYWRPNTERNLTHWVCAHHLIRVLEAKDGGSEEAAKLLAEMNSDDADAARNLAYRLYDICEKKGWAQEARSYNLLAEEFFRIEEYITEKSMGKPTQEDLI